MRVSNGSDSRRLSLRRLALVPRLWALLALPLIALTLLLAFEGVGRYNEVRSLNEFRGTAAELRVVYELVGSLQESRAASASTRIGGLPVLSSTESVPNLDAAIANFEATSFASAPELISVPSLVKQAQDLSAAAGTSRPDAGYIQYSAAIDRLLTAMDAFTTDVPSARIARSFDAGVEALHAGEQFRLQDLEVHFANATGTLDTAAIGRSTAKELDALAAFRREASVEASERLVEAQIHPSWSTTTRLRNELINPITQPAVDLEAWVPAAQARFAAVEDISNIQELNVLNTINAVSSERSRSFLVLALTSALAALVILAAMILLSRSITQPLQLLAHAARELKAGRVVSVTPDGQDEITDVEHAFKDVDDVMQNLMAQVVRATDRFQGRDYEARIRTEEFSGRWAELGTTINDGMDALVEGERREREASAQAAFAQTHDLETGLPDASHFRQLAADRFGHPMRNGTGILVVRPENLRNLQSVHTEDGVELAMVSFGRRVRGALAQSVIVGRLTSHEYAVAHDSDANVVGELTAAFANPFVLRGEEIAFPISVGYSDANGHRSVADEVSRAVIAANYAEAQRTNKPVPFTREMRDGVVRRAEVREWLEESIRTNDLEPWYQPVFEIASGKLVGYETLARGWMKGKPVSPAEFVAVAEQDGLVGALGEVMMHKSLGDHPKLPGFEPSLAINFAVDQLKDPSIVSTIIGHLERYQVDPQKFIVEITENAMVDNDPDVLARLHQMRELGIRIAVDDFGTGYSSLSYLSRLPLDIIKLDRSIITPITQSDAASAVVQRTIELAKDLSHVVVAEGVEEPEQLEALRAMGCDRVQGYLTGRPASLSTLRAETPQSAHG